MEMKRARSLIFLLSLVGFFASCIDPTQYPNEPEISNVRLSRTIVDQQDTFHLYFDFTDGDGDLGFQDVDFGFCALCDSIVDTSCYKIPELSILITNLSTGCLVSAYQIPYIPPKGSSSSISGEISVRLFDCCFYPDLTGCYPNPAYPFDTVRYEIRIKDRSGNVSNKLVTQPMYINCNA